MTTLFMMKYALALALVLLSLPAQAWDRGCLRGIRTPSEMVGVIPTVKYHVLYFPSDLIMDLCEDDGNSPARAHLGCVSEERPGEYYIYINTKQNMADRLCTLWHEKAHLPPTSWVHARYIRGPVYHSLREGTADVLRRIVEDPR